MESESVGTSHGPFPFWCDTSNSSKGAYKFTCLDRVTPYEVEHRTRFLYSYSRMAQITYRDNCDLPVQILQSTVFRLSATHFAATASMLMPAYCSALCRQDALRRRGGGAVRPPVHAERQGVHHVRRPPEGLLLPELRAPPAE